MRRRVWSLLGAVLVVAALVVVPAAGAKVALTFQRATVKPGVTVTATGVTVWPDARQYLDGFVVYLIPTKLGHADYNTGLAVLPPPGSEHTYRVGTMTEQDNRLFIRFKVPTVPPGDYTTAVWCKPHTHCGPVGTFDSSVLWGQRWTGKAGLIIRVTR